KDYEPDPSKEQAGFREPRKVKVEWVSVSGEEPYYRKLAAEWANLTEQMAKSEVKGLVVPVPGFGIAAWPAIVLAPAAIKEPLVYGDYERKVYDHKLQLDSKWDRPSFSNLFGELNGALDTSVVKPQNLAAVAGGAAGALVG